jgi:hypothetical protein
VGGTEGDSYAGLAGPPEHLPPVPAPSPAYPVAESVDATAIIVARDAARTIGWTVASLRWTRQVVVVDQASTDDTAALARAAGAVVRDWPHATVTGRAILARLLGETPGWVVLLDADEMLTAAAAHAVAAVIAADSADAIEIRRATHLFGRRVRGEALGSGWAVRAGKSEQLIAPTGLEALRVPLSVRPNTRILRLADTPEVAVVHFGAPDLHGWLAKMNERTSLEARGTELPGRVTGRRTAKRFVTSYAAGWREGRLGLRLSLLNALAKWVLTEKAADLVDGDGTTASATYDEIAARVLGGGPID